MSDNEYVLEMRNISKEFPGVKALDDVTLTVAPGTVHAIVGENGAGKSTLMKCVFGIYSTDKGEVLLDGRPVSFVSTKQALDAGIAMIQQELLPVRNGASRTTSGWGGIHRRTTGYGQNRSTKRNSNVRLRTTHRP